MRTLFLGLFISAVLSYGNSTDKETQENAEKTAVVAMNDNEEQETMLTGVITRNDLEQAPFRSWFKPVYKSFSLSEKELELFRNNLDDYEIQVFMSTWCADSRREVPKLFKLLELADYDMNKLEVVAVDLNKTLPKNLQHSAEFQWVPTIIFYKDGKEVNRFVEFPQESFKEDIAKIITEEEYKHSHAE